MEGVDLEAGDAEYQELLEMYDQSLRTLAEGEVVRGRVASRQQQTRSSSTSVINPKESSMPMSSSVLTGKPHVAVGDEIDVSARKD